MPISDWKHKVNEIVCMWHLLELTHKASDFVEMDLTYTAQMHYGSKVWGR